MKIDPIMRAKLKEIVLFCACPMAIQIVLMILIFPFAFDTSSILSWLMPFATLLVFLPFNYVASRRRRADAVREECELQAKYDIEDKAMFGKPLREIEL